MTEPLTLPDEPRAEPEAVAPSADGAPRTDVEPSAAERARRRVGAEIAWGALSAVGAVLGAVMVLRLWKASLNIPLRNGGDTFLTLMTVKNMQSGGWSQFGAALDAPFRQNLAAYPSTVGDFWNLVVLKVLSLALSPSAAVNVFYVAGFAAIAVVAYASLRILTVSPPLACALGAVYAWLPYHFLRGEGHLLLSAYYAVPLAVVVAVGLLTTRLDLWQSPRRWRWQQWCALAGAVLLAGTGLYYAAFTLVLFVAAGILASIAHRSWRPAVSAALLSMVVVVGLAIAALPNLLFTPEPGATAFAVDGRGYGATEYYGLKITNLFLPLGSHRIAALGALHSRTADSLIPGEGSETLGVLGSVGLVIAVVVLLMPVVRRAGLTRRLRELGSLAIVMIVAATVAGLNGLLAVLGFAELRAWNRSSVVIAFIALAALGLSVDAVLRRRIRGRGRRIGGLVAIATAGALALVGLLDQTSNNMIPDYPATALAWQQDASYFGALQDEYGAGSAVFELPYVPFPENPPVVHMADYEHLRGYLHSDLEWSYGGVKGQESEWQPEALADGVAAALPKLVATGFDAVYVNRLGYADNGAEVESEIRAVTGDSTPMVNADRTLATYDLRPYAARLRAAGEVPDADAILYHPRIEAVAGVYPEEQADGQRWRWAQQSGELGVVNPSGKSDNVRLTGTVYVAKPGAKVRFTTPDGTDTLVAGADGTAQLDLTLSVPARSVVDVGLSTDSSATPAGPGDQRVLYIRLIDPEVSTD